MTSGTALAVPACTVKGDGEVLLFLHGVGGAGASWAPQLSYFAKEFQAAAWDMPGYGKSIPLNGMAFPSLAEALLALLDARDWDRVHLVGHSMGGMIAQEFAATHQDRVRSLVLFATSPAFGRPDGDFQKKFVADRLAPLAAGATMADLAAEVVGTMLSPDADPAGRELARTCMAAVPPESYQAAVECIVTFDRRAALGDIRVPTLVLAGETDTNAPAPMMERMAAKIPGATFVCLPGRGHLANLEDPAAFNAALEAFLARMTT